MIKPRKKIKEITSQDFQFVPDSLSLYTNNISGVLHNQDNFINNKIALLILQFLQKYNRIYLNKINKGKNDHEKKIKKFNNKKTKIL